MKHTTRNWILSASLTAVGLCATPAVFAQQQGNSSDPDMQNRQAIGAGQRSENLPPPRSDNDAQPPVASPMSPPGGIVHQAGVGGTTAYARAGVLELGGNVGLNISNASTNLTIAPTIGWFFADNIEISGIFGYRYNHVSTNGISADSHELQILAEPSYHIPFSRTLFGFVGVGLGLSYNNVNGAGFALAPRLGLNIAVGRSGILTPAAQFQYSTNDTVQTPNGTLVAVSASYGFNVGYTVMW
ncbi:MAG: hypothetical protein R3A52_04625 [Polyangiales bacterium]